jgi:hypothetical protein
VIVAKPVAVTPKPAAPMQFEAPSRVEAPRPLPAPIPKSVKPFIAPAPVAPPRPAPARKAPVASSPELLDKPTPSFRASQATRAAHVAAPVVAPKSLDCPNCSAKVPPTVRRCRCGFEMPHFASQIPSLPLSPEERAAFLAALAPTGNDPSH